MTLEGKTVLLGVTGSIAAYKIAYLASALKKRRADVHVLMTKNATNFINPITFETLTGNKCLVDTFDRNFQFQVEHVSIAKKADVVMIAPASANVIGKLAHGIADDMLTTTIMACKCKKFISPAMNTNMFENPVVQDNLKILEHYGYEVIAPASGYLACGDTGAGKMPEPETLLAYIEREAACEKDLKGKKILVTAGPTQEAIDPVRYITNHSSGKMGYAIAKAAMLRGADVTLVSGRTAIEPPMFVKIVPVVTAKDMYEAVTSVSDEQDIIIKAAAVADYRPAKVSDEKVKKSDGQMSIELERTDDILKFLGEHKRDGQFLCGFSMETQNVIGNSRAKLTKKNLDMVAANNVKVEGAGFQGDTNVLTLITQDEEVSLPLMSKEDAALKILDKIVTVHSVLSNTLCDAQNLC
ncbi:MULTISPECIES: bifunctional phosphopantothenoylcysteine decarboxylase/phosphopantothenate--cysteine ligase CoaBC [unclassified Blautia]|uniref:bifunctional phosphopantothenoylcysteine decarboxylase/phosphopantothenate--cysteine ligase CoaBC n=1 Tax=unclassified Blautia TaxID=2648079 RepID=UPI003F8910F0